MNLEELRNELRTVVKTIESNNTNHFGLNEKLLNTPPAIDEGSIKATQPYQEGLLTDIYEAVTHLKILSEEQSNNLERTAEIILSRPVTG